MKKSLIILLFIPLIFACSKDDNDDANSNDPIIGEWVAYRGEEKISNAPNSDWNVYNFDYTFNILNDGTFTDSDGCSGVWEKTTNNQFNYKVYYNCDGEEEIAEIKFYCNNNIMRFTDEYTIGQVYGYYHKSNYNPNNCNEVTYFGN